MRLPIATHTARPWHIHEIAPDFRVEDVWALPTPGGPDDFPRLVRQVGYDDPDESWLAGALMRIRLALGKVLRWDEPESGIGSRVPTLRERVPAELPAADPAPATAQLPFTPLYQTGDEWAVEIANRTVHGVIHLSWVPDGAGYRGQMAILVKPNGLLGKAYMAAILPFRYLIVYPAMLRGIGRKWLAAK